MGEAAHPATSAAAQALGIELPPHFAARKFDYTNDTVHFDMILVMDKFTAGDVMREVQYPYFPSSAPLLRQDCCERG